MAQYQDFWDRSANWLLAFSTLAGLLAAVGILGWQTFTWLRTGTWVPLPLYSALDYLGADLALIYNPSNWYGAAAAARWVLDLPLALCIPAAIVIALLCWKAFLSSN